MPTRFLKLIFILLLASCARVQTLNMEKHAYSDRPRHIIWIQLAGFSEEHIPLLKFNIPDIGYRTGLEKFDCIGKLWNYNLYDLRPDSANSFLSQLNGSKNIKNRCEDFESKAAWDYIDELGYRVSIFENNLSDDRSLLRSRQCSKPGIVKLNNTRFYRSGAGLSLSKNLAQKSFHYQDSTSNLSEEITPGLYDDKSCQKELCYSSISNNFKTLWANTMKDQFKTFFLMRDYSFYKALKKKDITLARESLQEIERILNWVNSQNRNDVLIILTGAESINLEFPNEGKEWAEFEKSGKNILYKNATLMSPVLAKGSMSENFCGLFEESEMLKRLLYKPERKQLDWELLNPF